MKKRFIVLVDLHEDSKVLISFAQAWAKEAEAEMLIAHQSFSLDPALGESELRSDIRKQHRKDMLLELTSFLADTVDYSIPVKFHITTGNMEASILKLNNSSKLDILFAGLKDKGMIERIFMKSTPIKLADEVNKIIVAIPDGNCQPKLNTIVVGVHEKYPLNEAALRDLLSTCKDRIEKVQLLSLVKPDKDTETTVIYLETLCRNFSQEILMEYEIVQTSDSLQAMKDYMQERDCFLVIQKGSRNILDLFRKSFVNELVNYGQMPLIILPSQAL